VEKHILMECRAPTGTHGTRGGIAMARSYDEVIGPLREAVEPTVAAAVVADMEAAYDLVFGLGDAVAARRAELHLSQVDLARVTGVPQADISRIERGKGNPTLGTLVKLFKALDLTMSVSPTPFRASH
jgi:XRE family transcriptional regulator, regulator of sulfur utilization